MSEKDTYKHTYYKINNLDDLLQILAEELKKYGSTKGEIDFHYCDTETLALKFEYLPKEDSESKI